MKTSRECWRCFQDERLVLADLVQHDTKKVWDSEDIYIYIFVHTYIYIYIYIYIYMVIKGFCRCGPWAKQKTGEERK